MNRVLSSFATLITVCIAAVYLWPAPPPASHLYLQSAPKTRAEIIAHGGGQGHAPPNTITALQTAMEMGADVLEVDVQQTRNGVLVLRHDDTLDRTTDMTGRIADYSWQELKQADAGARTFIGDVDFAGRGIGIPRLDDALAAFPDQRWILEIKNNTASAAQAMCDEIKRAKMDAQILVGSFHDEAMAHFRAACPQIATSMSTSEVREFVIAARLGLSRFISTPAIAMQIPAIADGLDLTHKRIIDAAHARGFIVQYWTINDTIEMETLLNAGADGLITDYVDRGFIALEE